MRAGHLKTTRRTLTITAMLLGLGGSGLPAAAQVRGDFNGDGHSDLAIGVLNESIGTAYEVGAVNVLYGSAGPGLTADDDQIWHQNSAGIASPAERDDGFGFSLAVGDFNGDGYSDLAVGVISEATTRPNTGAVNVIYGSMDGLDAAGDQFWHQDIGGVDGIAGVAESGDNFGFALAAGDFNADGYDDLAVGVPGETVGAAPRAGAVNVIYGSMGGLTATGNQMWHQDSAEILDDAEAGDELGHALAAGDFNGDGIDDLAVGVPAETLVDPGFTFFPGAGAVNVIYGDWDGLTAAGNQFWHQDVPGMLAKAEGGDAFGSSLAAGDFNGDTYDDLAVGVVSENVGRKQDVGAVNVLYGFHEGLIVDGNQVWHQDIARIREAAEPEDGFGSSLAAGDFDGDAYDDLAVGVVHETVGRHAAGAVNVLYGRANGLGHQRNQLWRQSSRGLPGAPENWDQFGHSLASGDFNGDGACDLAIGVFNESLGTINGGGAVNVLYGAAASGLASAGSQIWHQNSPGVIGVAELFDWFGFALASR